MPRTLGYHYVKSTYGMWLPGDERGHWSDIWDDQIGFFEPHTPHEGDPVRKRMAEDRLLHPPLRLSAEMRTIVDLTLAELMRKSRGDLYFNAGAIEETHVHLLIPYSGRDIDKTVKWIADQTTKAVHRSTSYQGPVWCKGRWRSFIYDELHWNNLIEYIEQHNLRRGRERRPFAFLLPL